MVWLIEMVKKKKYMIRIIAANKFILDNLEFDNYALLINISRVWMV